MAYADAAFYTGTYNGTLPADTTLDALLARASDDIDAATYYRIPGFGGIGTLTVFQQRQIQLAVCAQADYVQSVGGLVDIGGAAGFSIGDAQMQMGNNPLQALGPRAHAYLLPTMLLFRGAY